MALGNNENLITTANLISVVADGGVESAYSGTASSDAYIFASGDTGDDDIFDFQKRDSLIFNRKLFDGNNDGIIGVGPNGEIAIDRTSAADPGGDQIQLIGSDPNGPTAIRYLGSKGGAYVYADASVKRSGMTEGTVGNDSFNAGGGAKKYLYDTALGLNLGGDKISNFGADDRIVTTTAIAGVAIGGKIGAGSNKVFDLPGQSGISSGDGTTQGGQINIVGVSTLRFLSEEVIGETHYYYYGV